jgi:tetratricopeptide (TPR) repeat protein
VRQQLASELVRKGDILVSLRRADDALAAFREAESVRRALLTSDPKNARLERELVGCLDRIAGTLLTQQKAAAARDTLVEAMTRHGRLLAHEPRNVELRRMGWILQNSSAMVAVRQGDFDAALKSLEEALTVERALLAEDDSRLADRNGLAESYHQMALVLMSRPIERQTNDDLRRAADYVNQSLVAFEVLAKCGSLSAAQIERRQAVQKTRDIIQQAIGEIDKLKKP